MQGVIRAPRQARPTRSAAPVRQCVARGHPMSPTVDVDSYRQHEDDSGSTSVQVAQLSARITHLTTHLQANRKDLACQRGLQQILAKRKKMLKYLYSSDKRAFAHCVRSLKIRNPLQGVVMLRDDDEERQVDAAEEAAQAAAGFSMDDAGEEEELQGEPYPAIQD